MEEIKSDTARPAKTKAFPEIIPSFAGAGYHRKKIQQQTLTYWTLMVGLGLVIFHGPLFLSISIVPKQRAAALGLLFPGAGYIACANVTGLILGLTTLLLYPLCGLIWFGAGGVLFPILLWLLSIGGAFFAADSQRGVLESAGIISVVIWAAVMLYFRHISQRARAEGALKRQQRNAVLPGYLDQMASCEVIPPQDGDRELALDDLRRVQWLFDVSNQNLDDFSNFVIIDQFQPAAIRYQLYEMAYSLCIYQGVYTPNFHGYASAAIRHSIEKSLSERVMGFWKWETLWGKFKFDFDPIKEDNIMVSGWLILALALYTSNTGDMCYTEPDSLEFKVSKRSTYKYDIHSIARALVRQWRDNPYCLFACEPSWIYTPCNLYGWTGQVVYDRVFKADDTKNLAGRFEQALVSEFMEEDGSILPIRNEFTGFSIPGLCGALGDLSNAMFCRGHSDHIARRMWALFRNDFVKLTEKGGLEMVGLVGADKIDAGTYKSNEWALYPMLASVAGEFGDETVRTRALAKVEDGVGIKTEATGAIHLNLDKISFHANTGNVKGRLLRGGDWKRLVLEGPSEEALAGPILQKVPYPGILVAQARSITGRDLKLVLHPSKEAGTFPLGISRLQPGKRYIDKVSGLEAEADATGYAEFDLPIRGRTVVQFVPQEP